MRTIDVVINKEEYICLAKLVKMGILEFIILRSTGTALKPHIVMSFSRYFRSSKQGFRRGGGRGARSSSLHSVDSLEPTSQDGHGRALCTILICP